MVFRFSRHVFGRLGSVRRRAPGPPPHSVFSVQPCLGTWDQTVYASLEAASVLRGAEDGGEEDWH